MATKTRPTKAKVQTNAERVAEFTREVATWPTIRELADTYGLSERWVREQVSFRLVATSYRLDVIRVNPDEWLEFITERVEH